MLDQASLVKDAWEGAGRAVGCGGRNAASRAPALSGGAFQQPVAGYLPGVRRPAGSSPAGGGFALDGLLCEPSGLLQAGGGGGAWFGRPPPALAGAAGPQLGLMDYPAGWSGFGAFPPFALPTGAELAAAAAAAGFAGDGRCPNGVPLPSDGWWPPFSGWQQPANPFAPPPPPLSPCAFPPPAGFPVPAAVSSAARDEPPPPRAPRGLLAALLQSPPLAAMSRPAVESDSGSPPSPRPNASPLAARRAPQAQTSEYDRGNCRDPAENRLRHGCGPSFRRQSAASKRSPDHRGRGAERHSGAEQSPDPQNRRNHSAVPKQRGADSTADPELCPRKSTSSASRPSKSYLSQAFRAPGELSKPNRKLCLLDLNGTLIYRKRAPDTGQLLDWRLRPHLGEFIEYLFMNFEVMVWSSATTRNVRRMVSAAFPSWAISRLIAVWDRSFFNLPAALYSSKLVTIKDLQAVWDKVPCPAGAPAAWDQSNTILIDDSAEKAVLQPYNCVLLKSFDLASAASGADRELKNVRKYLEALLPQRDVS
ncbi:MAG: HAD-like domain-containing protein, partial [Olpidium bornovanus]